MTHVRIYVVHLETSGELDVVTVEGHKLQMFDDLQVMIRVINLETKHEWIWSRQKFLNRKFVMQEMYDNFQEGEEWDLPPVSRYSLCCLYTACFNSYGQMKKALEEVMIWLKCTKN